MAVALLSEQCPLHNGPHGIGRVHRDHYQTQVPEPVRLLALLPAPRASFGGLQGHAVDLGRGRHLDLVHVGAHPLLACLGAEAIRKRPGVPPLVRLADVHHLNGAGRRSNDHYPNQRKDKTTAICPVTALRRISVAVSHFSTPFHVPSPAPCAPSPLPAAWARGPGGNAVNPLQWGAAPPPQQSAGFEGRLRAVLNGRRGGVWDPKIVYQNMACKGFPFVNFVISNNDHFGLEGGGVQGSVTSGFEISRMTLTSCQTRSAHRRLLCLAATAAQTRPLPNVALSSPHEMAIVTSVWRRGGGDGVQWGGGGGGSSSR